MAADEPLRGSVPVPDPTKLTTDAVNAATAQYRRELAAAIQIIEARLDAMDKATQLLAETVNRTPTVIQSEVGHLREVINARFEGIETLHRMELTERDKRASQGATASADALKAALDAAKELNQAQVQANEQANQKNEVRFNQQIKSLEGRLDDMKERFDRGEGVGSGTLAARNARRLDNGQLIAIVAVLVSIATIIIIATR